MNLTIPYKRRGRYSVTQNGQSFWLLIGGYGASFIRQVIFLRIGFAKDPQTNGPSSICPVDASKIHRNRPTICDRALKMFRAYTRNQRISSGPSLVSTKDGPVPAKDAGVSSKFSVDSSRSGHVLRKDSQVSSKLSVDSSRNEHVLRKDSQVSSKVSVDSSRNGPVLRKDSQVSSKLSVDSSRNGHVLRKDSPVSSKLSVDSSRNGHVLRKDSPVSSKSAGAFPKKGLRFPKKTLDFSKNSGHSRKITTLFPNLFCFRAYLAQIVGPFIGMVEIVGRRSAACPPPVRQPVLQRPHLQNPASFLRLYGLGIQRGKWMDGLPGFVFVGVLNRCEYV